MQPTRAALPEDLADPEHASLDHLLMSAMIAAPIGLIVLDADGSVRLLTGGAALLLGLNAAIDWRGRTLAFVLALCPSIATDKLQLLSAALAAAHAEAVDVYLPIRAASATRTVRLDIRAAGRRGWVLSLEDVTRTRQTPDWLLEHAAADPVTGLWNRQHFMLMLHDRLTALPHEPPGQPPACHALLLVGLHRFKQVNDLLGPGATDLMLRLIAERLASALAPDDMLARVSGDEFAAFIRLDGAPGAPEAIANRIFALLGEPCCIDGQPVSLSAHIGLACVPGHGISAETLVANAGFAILETTARGASPICVYEPALTERASSRRMLEADLRLALGRGQFELHYQPQVDVRHNCVTGVEALIRWRHPDRGLVPPVEFIALAEQIGLINDIGAWVLRAACREAAPWPAEITIAVNASPLQFETGSFAQLVAETLRETGLPATRLEIEITESLLLRDTGTVTDTLQALHRQGVRLVLDDFGTGYASLSQLSRFRFDKIKIDRSFVSPADMSLQNSAIVRSIAALGHSLGIPTTAEGVETQTQLEQITADGCTSVQGYYFSRPVPSADVVSMLTRLHVPGILAAA